MPKKSNPKKLAAVLHSTAKALDEATVGQHLVAKVEKALGNCAFAAVVELPTGATMATQVLIRGKFKGGNKNGVNRVIPGCYVLVEGDPTKAKVLEVVGVVNRQSGLERLKRSDRGAALTCGADLDDLFDRSEEDEEELDPWAKELDEHLEKRAEGLAARYGRKERTRDVAPEAGSALDTDLAEGFDLFAEAAAARKLRRAPRAPKEPYGGASGGSDISAPPAPTEEELAEELAAAAAEALKSRAVPTCWEDELDIDAI